MLERKGGKAGRREAFVAALRRIVGMPDYTSFVEHMKRKHPDCAVPTEREYFDQYVTARYSSGPTRCC